MSLPSIFTQWCLEDRPTEDPRYNGWYVISPWGGECGPFTEEEGAAKMRELRAYPVWCPTCLVPMVQMESHHAWKCPTCQLVVAQQEIARIIKVNE